MNKTNILYTDAFDKILKALAKAPPINHKREIASLTSEIDDLRHLYKRGDIMEVKLNE